MRKTCERSVLHSDLNCFYASVETVLNPEYAGKAIAVCGSTEDRHGIVLAKSEKAKRAGVKTGMVNHEAKALCPDLIIVEPHFESYVEFSKIVRSIYSDYTDLVEPFGMDECWLDVTGSVKLCGSGEHIANELRERIKRETGLTVSVGVSFCKSFAKLGSDMKKPDAVTVIDRENFREKIWQLPASELLFVGRATAKKMNSCGILTIGDMARVGRDTMTAMLGVRGTYLWEYANGEDRAPVMHREFEFPVKSVGHGITCLADLTSDTEVANVILELCQDIGHRLRVHGLAARGVMIAVKDNRLFSLSRQRRLSYSTMSPGVIAKEAFDLFRSLYKWENPVRALTVTAIDTVSSSESVQLDLFGNFAAMDRRRQLDDAVDFINSRFGSKTVRPLSVIDLAKLPGDTSHETTLPGNMIY